MTVPWEVLKYTPKVAFLGILLFNFELFHPCWVAAHFRRPLHRNHSTWMLSSKAYSSYVRNCFSKRVFSSTYLWSQLLRSPTQRIHRHRASPSLLTALLPSQDSCFTWLPFREAFFILLLLTIFPLTKFCFVLFCFYEPWTQLVSHKHHQIYFHNEESNFR